jgi:hypothetical protein
MLGVSSAFADPQKRETGQQQGQQKKPVKKANINFEDELVEGGTNKPELFYLLQKKQFNYKRLIKLREDFIPEMKSTAEDVQRRGSGD